MEELLERLKKAEPDSHQDITELIERHIQNTNNLNMLLDAIPKFLAQSTGGDESDAREIIPDLLDCKTPDEICKELNKWICERTK